MLLARPGRGLSAIRRAARTMSSTSSSLPVLPLQPPSLDEETALFEQRTAEMASFFDQPRFASIKRPYSPSSVASKQGSLPVLPLHGTTTEGGLSLAQVLSDAEARGASGAEVDQLEKEWTEKHEMCTFDQGKSYPWPLKFGLANARR